MPSIDVPATLQRVLKLQQQGKFAEAEPLLREVVAFDPANADAWNMLGVLRHLSRDPVQAHEYLSNAVRLVPNANTRANLASTLFALGRDAEGEALLLLAQKDDPKSVLVVRNLALFYFLRGRHAESAATYRQVTQLEPNSGEVYFHLGNALWKAGDAKGAVAALRNSVRLAQVSAAYNSLGLALQSLGEIDETIGAFRRAIEMDANDTVPMVNLGNTLRSVARIGDAMHYFQQAVRGGNQHDAAENILFTTHYVPGIDVPAITELHNIWGKRYLQAVKQSTPVVDRADRPLRVGFVSGDFSAHAAARFLLPLFQQLNREKIQLCLYSNNAMNDGRTAQFQQLANLWRDIRNIDDDAACQQIIADKIDLLIDLSLHTEGNRLGIFARKPAPVQATWLGYAGTTGLSTIDYRLSDPRLDPDPAEDRFYAEKTLRLADCFWCFQPFDVTPAVGPSPCASAGHVTFGSLNNFAKVNEEVQAMWAVILQQVPNSRIIIHSARGSHRGELRKIFAKAGVVSSRIEFVEFLPTPDYLNLHNRIDIALDPFPFAGGTTTCDALWMGVPVVTLAGKTPTGRGGASILHTVGTPELIASSEEAYGKIAIDLARDPSRLAQYRSTLRDRVTRSLLTDAPRFARNFEAALRTMWLSQPV